MDQRLILAVGAGRFANCEGFVQIGHNTIIDQLESAGVWWGPRAVLEDREEFLQLIPYVMIRHRGRFLTFVRGAAIEEGRLAGKLALGLGGHVDFGDATHSGKEGLDLDATLWNAYGRELKEEASLETNLEPKWLGLIIDRSDAVGRVHLGLVALLDVEDVVTSAEPEICTNFAFMTPEEIIARPEKEGWTSVMAAYTPELATWQTE